MFLNIFQHMELNILNHNLCDHRTTCKNGRHFYIKKKVHIGIFLHYFTLETTQKITTNRIFLYFTITGTFCERCLINKLTLQYRIIIKKNI